MKLVFATGNAGKLREAGEILEGFCEVLSPAALGFTEDVEETGTTLKENSLLKARAVYEATGADCFADDSGLEVDALGGAPGVYSARYAGDSHDFNANIEKLLRELEKHPGEPRTARFRCVVTLILGGEVHFFEGAMEGRIAMQKSGSGGFGYDPVFLCDAFPGHSLAEVPEEEKNAVSHRGQALRLMADYIKLDRK